MDMTIVRCHGGRRIAFGSPVHNTHAGPKRRRIGMSEGLKRYDKDKKDLLMLIDGELKSTGQALRDASTSLLPKHSIGSLMTM